MKSPFLVCLEVLLGGGGASGACCLPTVPETMGEDERLLLNFSLSPVLKNSCRAKGLLSTNYALVRFGHTFEPGLLPPVPPTVGVPKVNRGIRLFPNLVFDRVFMCA